MLLHLPKWMSYAIFALWLTQYFANHSNSMTLTHYERFWILLDASPPVKFNQLSLQFQGELYIFCTFCSAPPRLSNSAPSTHFRHSIPHSTLPRPSSSRPFTHFLHFMFHLTPLLLRIQRQLQFFSGLPADPTTVTHFEEDCSFSTFDKST